MASQEALLAEFEATHYKPLDLAEVSDIDDKFGEAVASNDEETHYVASPICTKFHKDISFIRSLIGPIGSGKSVACINEMFIKSIAQEPYKGVRKSRWVVVRNTYRELIDTTIATYADWFENLGTWRKMDMKHTIVLPLEDGTTMHMEVMFRALDKPDDIKKLLSLELTGGFLNECREIPKQVLDMLIGRVGRYPSKRDGGATWWGVIMDTNPPDSDHWFHNLFEEDIPEDFAIFHQPSGLAPDAENIENLPARYYERMSFGKDPEWVKVYVHGQYGFVTDGIPVVPEFHDHQHIVDDIGWDPEKDSILYIGVDFGRTPAAVFAKEIDGQVQVFDELCTFGNSVTNFSSLVAERIKGHYATGRHGRVEIVATGDPAGENPGEQIDDTCIDIMNNAGIPIEPAETNNFTIRREAVSIPLTTLTMRGVPMLVIGRKCKNLCKGMNGGYKYKRMQVSGEKFQLKPDKNKYSHVCEALQYLLLGMGKGYDVLDSHNVSMKHKVIGALGNNR